MSGARGFTFFLGKGNAAFFQLLKPIAKGWFSTVYSKALTYGTVGTTAVGLVNTGEDYRKGNISGKEAISGAGALFFGCLGGSNTVLSIAYSGLASYLTVVSVTGRVETFREKNPDTQFVPDGVVKGSDYAGVLAPLPVTLTNEVSKITGGNAGKAAKGLWLAYSCLNLNPSHIRDFVTRSGGDGTKVELSEKVPPDSVSLKIASLGDQLPNSTLENTVIQCGPIDLNQP